MSVNTMLNMYMISVSRSIAQTSCFEVSISERTNVRSALYRAGNNSYDYKQGLSCSGSCSNADDDDDDDDGDGVADVVVVVVVDVDDDIIILHDDPK